MTLPKDSALRKDIPMASGCLAYFPAALAGVAHLSKIGNDKHNPGEPLHHSRDKSGDHADCIVRHLVDLQEELAAIDRADYVRPPMQELALRAASAVAWRALALSQELHETFGWPVAPAARLPIVKKGKKK